MKTICFIFVSILILSSPLLAADWYVGLNYGSMFSSTIDQGTGYSFNAELRLQINKFFGLAAQTGHGKFGKATLGIGTREGSKVLFERYSVLFGDFRDQKINYFFSLGRSKIDVNRDFDYNTDGWHTNFGLGINYGISKRIGINLNLDSSGWLHYDRLNTTTFGVHYLLSNGGI